MESKISIDVLMDIVRSGGKVMTGVDVYNPAGVLLLAGDSSVGTLRPLEVIKKNGIGSVPVDTNLNGALLDSDGNGISMEALEMAAAASHQGAAPASMPETKARTVIPSIATNEIEVRLVEIEEKRRQALQKHAAAKKCINNVLKDIQDTDGQFDYTEVEKTVSDLTEFLIVGENPFSYLTQEMFSYDEYLYNHSINVCAIGTAVLIRFNQLFSKIVNDHIKCAHTADIHNPFTNEAIQRSPGFTCFYPNELEDISLGFFLHDIGKTLVPDHILNKNGKLTGTEFLEVKKHSYEYGETLIQKNHIRNATVENIVGFHHAPLYAQEERTYPAVDDYSTIPICTRICKLADIYDAMTSRRCYKESFNPVNVVTQIFRSYAKKDPMLQYILHAFVKSIGIYPPGSIVFLQNGQMAYVLESKGPLLLPFTDEKGNTLSHKPDPVVADSKGTSKLHMVDNRGSVKSPKDVYYVLPDYLKKFLTLDK
ncbi:MAG: HD domain-containing protein [Desulfobacteraceae bacterium]|nr:HD domain-containing protein [Desulfobacteraceae bacterium]